MALALAGARGPSHVTSHTSVAFRYCVAQLGRVQRSVQYRWSATLIVPSPLPSRGSIFELAFLPLAAAIILMSTLSMSWSLSTSQRPTSHASPMPFLLASIWPGFGVFLQLSHASPRRPRRYPAALNRRQRAVVHGITYTVVVGIDAASAGGPQEHEQGIRLV